MWTPRTSSGHSAESPCTVALAHRREHLPGHNRCLGVVCSVATNRQPSYHVLCRRGTDPAQHNFPITEAATGPTSDRHILCWTVGNGEGAVHPQRCCKSAVPPIQNVNTVMLIGFIRPMPRSNSFMLLCMEQVENSRLCFFSILQGTPGQPHAAPGQERAGGAPGAEPAPRSRGAGLRQHATARPPQLRVVALAAARLRQHDCKQPLAGPF